jgi:hypothetical protein
MERDHEAEAQEPSRGGARQAGWPGTQRGQTPRQPHKWPQGWPGQKPQKTNCRPPQCTTSASGEAPQGGVSTAIALIRARFGCGAIGLGYGGIRFSTRALR